MKTGLCFAMLLMSAFAVRGVAFQFQKSAGIKDNEVYLIEGDEHLRVTNDKLGKDDLRWQPDGKHLSYKSPDDQGGMGMITVIDLEGVQTARAVVRPPTDPPVSGLRFVEGLEWISNDQIRVWGSINPRNCELFLIDIRTSKESHHDIYECATFAASHDQKHIASLGPVESGPPEDRFDIVQIDGERIYPPQGSDEWIQVVGKPAWSPDDRLAAFLSYPHSSNILFANTLDFSGVRSQTPVFPVPSGELKLQWVASGLLISGTSGEMTLVDPNRKTSAVVPDDRGRAASLKENRERDLALEQSLSRGLRSKGFKETAFWP